MRRRESPSSVAKFLEEFLEAVYPARCALCGGEAVDGLACGRHALPRAPEGPRCGRCASLLSAALPDGAICAACRRAPPGYRRLLTLADYRRQPVVREWILPFKHGGRRDLAVPLGWALARRLAEGGGAGRQRRLLVPVPLHPLRRLERGHDQARLLAREVAIHGRLAWAPALRRRRWTPPQGAPGARSRAANVRDAFAALPRWGREVEGAEVWLVDDVVSSGATAGACARELRRLGARTVSVLCVARP